MSNRVIVKKIKLPEEQDPDAFATFMRDEYFPAVHKGATRVGAVEGLTLLQHSQTRVIGSGNAFLMLTEWNGLPPGEGVPVVDDEEVQRKFESFGAQVEALGVHDQVAVWPKDDAG